MEVKQRRTRAKRKLVSSEVLDEVVLRLHYGAPINRIKDDLDLDISRPALLKLANYYVDVRRGRVTPEAGAVILDSLFPEWLTGTDVQISPDDWVYYGRFPYGQWVKE